MIVLQYSSEFLQFTQCCVETAFLTEGDPQCSLQNANHNSQCKSIFLSISTGSDYLSISSTLNLADTFKGEEANRVDAG